MFSKALDCVAEDASLDRVLKKNKLSKSCSVFRNFRFSVVAIGSVSTL